MMTKSLTFNYKEGQKTITFGEVDQKMNQGNSGSNMELPGEPKSLFERPGLFVVTGKIPFQQELDLSVSCG